jgi:hypothetical protein
VTLLVCFLIFAHWAMGAGSRTRHSLRPPIFEGDDAQLGQIMPRECGGVSAGLFDMQIGALLFTLPWRGRVDTRSSGARCVAGWGGTLLDGFTLPGLTFSLRSM